MSAGQANDGAPDFGASRSGGPDSTASDFGATLARAPVPWAGRFAADAPAARVLPLEDDASLRLLFVRAIARRNFSGFPFWVTCPPETCAALAGVAAARAEAEHLGPGHRLAALSPADIGILRERMLLPERPVSFPGSRDHKQVFLPPSGNAGNSGNSGNAGDSGNMHTIMHTHALLGEVEHWTRIRTWGPSSPPPERDGTPSGIPPDSSRNELVRVARLFAQDAHAEDPRGTSGPAFARTDTWGFLSSHPAHAGHGLQFEAGLHLPALSAMNSPRLLMQTRQALGVTGYDLQALSLREPGATEAGFFRLVSRGGAGISEEEHAAAFAEKVGAVLRAESEAWARWRAREPRVLEDRMHRALRVLQEARRMDHPELQLLSSFARAGVYAGAFPVALLPTLETLRVKAGPFHVHALGGDGDAADGGDLSEAVVRAGLARRLLSLP